MSTTAAGDARRLSQISKNLSTAASDLARYPALAHHATEFAAVANDLLMPPLIVVVGVFNAGKSTLLNAMLGRELLSMHVLPETAAVTMLRKGQPGNVLVHCAGCPASDWPLSKLAALTSESDTASAAIRESISFIEVPLDSSMLECVTLVDTPGLNSLNELHTRATEDFVHRAQAVLWVVSGIQALNDKELSWIEQLPQDIKVLVAINQIDLIDPYEGSVEGTIEKVQNCLLRSNVSVSAVSAKLALEGMLSSDRQRLEASLWDQFRADCEKDLFHLDVEKRIEHAAGEVDRLLGSLHAELEKHLCASAQDRLRAKGGDDYHTDLQARMADLSRAEKVLNGITEANAAAFLKGLAIEDYWDGSRELEMKRQALIGSGSACDVQQAEIDNQYRTFSGRRDQFTRDSQILKQDMEAYMKSGFFGGEPVFFKGKMDGLRVRSEGLEARDRELISQGNALWARKNALKDTRNRTNGDCAEFLKDLIAAVRRSMSSVADESSDAIGEQNRAAARLRGYEWISKFATGVRNIECWTLVDLDDVEGAPCHLGSALHTTVSRFHTLTEQICSQEWHPTVPQPVPVPPPLERVSSSCDISVIHFPEETGHGMRIAILAATAATLIVSILLFWHAPSKATSATVPVAVESQTASGPAPVSALGAAPSDDISSIGNALRVDGFIPDGPMINVPGVTPNSLLHVQKASCSASQCEKLFVFEGSEAVWCEDLSGYSSFSVIQNGEPGKFTADFTKQEPDGTESASTAEYIWDGTGLARTVQPQSLEEDSRIQATSVEHPTSDPAPPAAANTAPHDTQPAVKANEIQTHIVLNTERRSDGQIEIDVVQALKASEALKNELINAETVQNEVWLYGTVSNEASSKLAEWNAENVQGVIRVHNNLQLRQRDRGILQTQAPPPQQMAKPTQSRSGVLHYQGPPVPFGGKVIFDDLPEARLQFKYDNTAWALIIKRNADGTKWVTLISLKHGYQMNCDLGWEIIE